MYRRVSAQIGTSISFGAFRPSVISWKDTPPDTIRLDPTLVLNNVKLIRRGTLRSHISSRISREIMSVITIPRRGLSYKLRINVYAEIIDISGQLLDSFETFAQPRKQLLLRESDLSDSSYRVPIEMRRARAREVADTLEPRKLILVLFSR